MAAPSIVDPYALLHDRAGARVVGGGAGEPAGVAGTVAQHMVYETRSAPYVLPPFPGTWWPPVAQAVPSPYFYFPTAMPVAAVNTNDGGRGDSARAVCVVSGAPHPIAQNAAAQQPMFVHAAAPAWSGGFSPTAPPPGLSLPLADEMLGMTWPHAPSFAPSSGALTDPHPHVNTALSARRVVEVPAPPTVPGIPPSSTDLSEAQASAATLHTAGSARGLLAGITSPLASAAVAGGGSTSADRDSQRPSTVASAPVPTAPSRRKAPPPVASALASDLIRVGESVAGVVAAAGGAATRGTADATAMPPSGVSKLEPTFVNGKRMFLCRYCEFTSPAAASVVAHERRCAAMVWRSSWTALVFVGVAATSSFDTFRAKCLANPPRTRE